MNTPSEVIQTVKQLQKKYYETAKELVIPIMQSLVQDPIQSYRFNAYTPYFSDGDECIYGLGDICFKVSKPITEVSNSDENEDEDEDYEDEDYEGSYKFSGKLKKGASEIESFLQQVPREILKEAVGDHVTVTVFSNNIEIESYEHD